MSLALELKARIQGEVSDDTARLDQASRDASLFVVKPEVVVAPRNSADVQAVVDFVNEKKKQGEHVSVTARSAGTDMSGGPLNDSIILDMTAHMNHLVEIHTEGDPYAIVEPGMYFRDFDKETKKKDLELPSYPASRELCTVGGMAANNSGGEKNLAYGKTARYVHELQVVLSDGQLHTLKNYTGPDLQEKLAEQSFEGNIYREMSALLTDHRQIIQDAAPKVEKNSSGYALWDMGNGVDSLNLARLFVGSQGTLGIITQITYGLVHPKPFASMVVIFLNDLSELGPIVPEVLAEKPDSFESYDDHTLKLAVKYFPEFAEQMKSNLFGLAFEFMPEFFMLVAGGLPKLVLLVEFRGDSQAEALDKARDLEKKLSTDDKIKVRVAPDEAATRKYWTIRRESFNLLRKKVRGKRTAPFIDDFVVPPASLPEFLPRLNDILNRYQLTYTVAGHVGDGNFHIIPLVDPHDATLRQTIHDLSEEVYDLVISYKGSITGEHNDGLVRTPYVEKMFGSDMYALFKKTKQIFDPENIFNPGKKVGTTENDLNSRLDLPAA